MNRGFFVSGVASHMTAQKLNTISHNLANVNTTGYMLDRTAFSTMLANLKGAAQDPSSMPAAYMTMDHQYINNEKGIIKKTGNDLDFAIRGDGYFQVLAQDPSGKEVKGYSRAGNFHLDADGTLLNEGNMTVLDDSGSPITLPTGIISASEDGAIRVDNQEVARLGIHKINDMGQVQKLSGAVLITPEANTQATDESISVHQGMLEGSNVNAVSMMVEMMQNTRENQSMMKVLEQYNQQAGLISEKVGRVG